MSNEEVKLNCFLIAERIVLGGRDLPATDEQKSKVLELAQALIKIIF